MGSQDPQELIKFYVEWLGPPCDAGFPGWVPPPAVEIDVGRGEVNILAMVSPTDVDILGRGLASLSKTRAEAACIGCLV